MSLIFDMILHIFNSVITIVYFTGVMKVKRKGRIINEMGLVLSLLVSASVSHIFRYVPPVRFIGVLVVISITAMLFFEASITSKVRTIAESILMSMIGELFGMAVNIVALKYGYNIMVYDSPDRAIISLALAAFVAGIVPIAILLRRRAKIREIWRVAMTQLSIMITQISMIMIAYFAADTPSAGLVYIITVFQIPGLVLSLFCTRVILASTRLTIDEKEQEFERSKADMEYDYYKLALESNEKLSVLRHDISNTLQTAMTLIRNGDIQKGNELLSDIDKVNRSTALFSCCDNDIVNVIITLKSEEMKKCDIEFKVSVKAEMHDIPVSDRELTSVLSNLLDNAKEACVKCNRKREVFITFGKQQGFFIIKVENTYCPDDVYIPDSVSDALTTKDDKERHGMGLRAIYEISKKYDGNFGMYKQDGMVVSVVTFAQKKE
ncbi:MAG: GHKL domain-containing protein [Ruminococcaceae bacterium]|nr:GHKL domain-containing protein [Oscillospiraceae bacterium]